MISVRLNLQSLYLASIIFWYYTENDLLDTHSLINAPYLYFKLKVRVSLLDSFVSLLRNMSAIFHRFVLKMLFNASRKANYARGGGDWNNSACSFLC